MKSTNQSGMRILSLVLSLLMVVSLLQTTAISVYADTVGGLTITGINGEILTPGTDFTYEDGVLTILSEKAVPIHNTNGTDTAVTDRIYVADGVNANVTLAGVNIEQTNNSAAFEIAVNSIGDVTVTLAENTENTLVSSLYYAGLQKSGSSDDIGELTITGEGKLTAIGGGYGAGIGCGYQVQQITSI